MACELFPIILGTSNNKSNIETFQQQNSLPSTPVEIEEDLHMEAKSFTLNSSLEQSKDFSLQSFRVDDLS